MITSKLAEYGSRVKHPYASMVRMAEKLEHFGFHYEDSEISLSCAEAL